MNKVNSFLIVIIMCFSLNAFSDTKVIRVVTDTWLNVTNKDGGGYFYDLLRAIYAPHEIKLNVQHMPYPRALVKLSNGEADLLLGAYEGTFEKDWYSLYPVGIDLIDVAMGRELHNQWQGKKSLEGKRIVAMYGYDADVFFDLKADYNEVSSVDSMVKMLMAGRADALIGYKKDFLPIKELLELDGRFIIKENVFKQPVYFVFHNSKMAISYKQLFNEGMKRLIDSGELKQMFTKEIGNMEYYSDYGSIQ